MDSCPGQASDDVFSTLNPERIDLSRVDDVRDVVHRAVACIAQGGVVGLPTETCYHLAASALAPRAVDLLVATTRNHEQFAPALVVRSPSEVADWAPNLSQLGHKLTRRAWPGPVTFVLVEAGAKLGLARWLADSVRHAVAPDGSVRLRHPAHDIVFEIVGLTPGPIVIVPAKCQDSDLPADSALAIEHHGSLEMLIDDGVGRPQTTTVVRVGDQGWETLAEGPVSRSELIRMAGTMLVFVCTGNTCRSPIAEALCKLQLAERLGCDVSRLEERGYVVTSAGLAAATGAPAAPDAIDEVALRGGSLRQHSSRMLTRELIERADWIVAMTREHRQSILEYHTRLGERIRLLDPTGRDIADPIGQGREVYHETADDIDHALSVLLDELGLPSNPTA